MARLLPALLCAVLSVVLLVMQGARKLSLTAPGVAWPAIVLFPPWLCYAFLLLSGGVGEALVAWTVGSVLQAVVIFLLLCFTAVLFLALYIKLNLFPGGAARLGRYAVGMGIWFQLWAGGILALAFYLVWPFLSALAGMAGQMEPAMFLLLLCAAITPFGFIIAIPLLASLGLTSLGLTAGFALAGLLTGASAILCVNAAVRLDRGLGRVRWQHIVLCLFPVANVAMVLMLLHRTKAAQSLDQAVK